MESYFCFAEKTIQMKKYIFIALTILFFGCKEAGKEKVDYKDSSLSIDERVDALVSQMTLEEKVVQLQCMWNDKKQLFNEENWFSPDSAKKYTPIGLGQIGRPSEGRTPEENAKLTNAIQKYFIEETRLGIPVFFHEECLHGHAALNKTSFCQPIGLASTWNVELIEELYTMTAKEARSVGTHQALTPVVDVAREPRWGRVEETFGEDPYLVSRMGLAAVRGFQGRDELVKGDHIMATLKHYAAHGQPESGTNAAPVNVSERTLRETFLYPFKTCVEQGNVKSIMASYNEIDGIPSHINSWLLEDVLRDEWNFKGTVVSDYYAIEELVKRHHVVDNFHNAGVLSLKNGVDVELPEPVAFVKLDSAVNTGQLDIKFIDRALKRVLHQKFEMGLFENPYVEVEKVANKVDTDENHALALKAAEETIVLLENKGNTLPLPSNTTKTIAVIGPNANRTLLGGYSGSPSYNVTVLEGLKKKYKDSKILFAQGCIVTKDSILQEDGSYLKTAWHLDPVEKGDRDYNLKLIKEAVRVAKRADIVILCVGGNEQTSREAWVESHMGDRTDLQLVGEQMELVRALKSTGKPLVSLLFNGKPLAVTELAEQSDALLECWYLGAECGNAVANILSGDKSPSGKLPISVPRSVGHIPSYYNYKPTARRGYLFDDVTALYPFGYGLSYSSFSYSDVTLSRSEMGKSDTVSVSVTVTNSGNVKAKETVQLYIRDLVSTVTRPVKELKAFTKVELGAGESKTVSFDISEEELGFWNVSKKFVVEEGEFSIMVGSSSKDSDLKTTKLSVK